MEISDSGVSIVTVCPGKVDVQAASDRFGTTIEKVHIYSELVAHSQTLNLAGALSSPLYSPLSVCIALSNRIWK